jgi:hypothetical protein
MLEKFKVKRFKFKAERLNAYEVSPQHYEAV